MMRSVIPGKIYRHFKGHHYMVDLIAEHTETGERMVVYTALYGENKKYVRPYDMFTSLVDREKYPETPQEYRFEPVKLTWSQRMVY